ncbi:hypothetical protein BGZ54_005714 [Gamsiella multidivaricata]|nr:hypothetical protein BGZ54_005714 [Gamsiella multidivaricata]
MTSNTGVQSRLGLGGVSGLASSLRSTVSASGNNNNYSNNNNSGQSHNTGGFSRGPYQQRDMDATVPYSDDSTEEDEEYSSYIQEQEQQFRKQSGAQGNNDINNSGSTANLHQMLREDDDQDQQHMDLDNNNELQARQNEILEDDDEDFDDEEDEDEDEDMDDERSEVLSLTEDDIDFNLVYAFHTFVATQEGQASVVRNDSLMLLEDTNVYWWLVRVLKTGVIGYIPAENIETPFERMARLNKYRNVGLSAPAPEWGTFDDPIQPLDAATLVERSLNRKSVIFNSQNEYFGASETEWDSEDDGEEDDDLDEYYEGGEDADEGEDSDRHGEEGSEQEDSRSGKTALQLEAERVEQEIMDEQRQQEEQQKQRQQQQQQRSRGQLYGVDDSEEEEEQEEEDVITNRHRRPLLDEDDLVFSDEPRKISLTPTIAQDDVSAARLQAPPGKAKKLRLADDEPSNNPRSGAEQQKQQGSSLGRSASFDAEEEDRQQMQKRMQERTDAKLAAILEGPGAAETAKKPGKFKSLFGISKGSKDKDKERKEKERLEKERLKNMMIRGSSSSDSNSANNSGADGNVNGASRPRTNSDGSIALASGQNTPMSPTFQSDINGETSQEIITLRVYPGNVDFGASMYKTVVVSPTTMASEVANQAVVKFKLAPDGVASATDFFLTVRGVDGDETVLQPTDKIMAIYQSLTAHLTTPLPPNHRLSISSVSSMMSINSISSQYSNPPSTPTSPNSVRRIGSGKSDPHQRSIRFLLNKKIRRTSSISSVPGTPTTPTTPTTPIAMQEDTFWVKVICMAQDLPQTMLLLDGMGSAMDRNDPRAQGQITATKVEHWLPMRSNSSAGDVVFEALEKINIRSGVVDGVPERVLAAKRNSAPNGVVVEYQLGLRLNGQTSRRAKQGDELHLAPQMSLVRCFEEHQLSPVRRSPKADVASMPLTPDHVFYLRKAAKSIDAEIKYEQQQQQIQEQQKQSTKKVPAPLQAQALRSGVNDSPKSPLLTSPTGMASPRSLRSLRSIEDIQVSDANLNGPASPASPGLHQAWAGGRNMNGPGSPSPVGADGNIRIPRRTDSSVLGPTSPTHASMHDHASSGRPSPTMTQQSMMGSRTPTPDHVGMGGHPAGGRNRSPSVSQGMRPGQAPSPAPSTEQENLRSSTPERPARAERQRATSPSMTHGPSPLSLTAMMLQDSNTNGAANVTADLGAPNDRPLSIAPLSIKKNATQGMDIVLNKGVIRSSRLMNSKQYRYSFIPTQGGDEVDISEIIEDILGEDGSDDAEEEEELQHLAVEEDFSSSPRRAAGGQPVRVPSNGSRTGANTDRDRLELLTNSSRGGNTLMKLERVLTREVESEKATTASFRSRSDSPRSVDGVAIQNQSRTLDSQSHSSKRNSDVEIQIASLASISTRSASPLLADQPPSARVLDAVPGSPRSLRPSSPFGMMAKPTLLSSPSSVGGSRSSPLKESSIATGGTDTITTSTVVQDGNTARSFSPIPRRLQSPSPASRQNTNASPASSPNMRPISPSTGAGAAGSGRASPVSVRSNSAASISSITSARNRSASTSVADNNNTSRLVHLTHSNSKNSSTTSLNSTSSKGEWLLSSDYNTGMQDLLTLVRAGRSSSVSSLPSSGSSMRPLIGKDGKIVALPSTIKASLLSSSSRGRSPSLSQLHQGYLDTQQEKQQGQKQDFDQGDGENKQRNDSNDKTAKDQQTRMMLMMLNELTLRDVQEECHPEVYDCWKNVDADLDRVERELDELLVTVKASIL